jgi:hypothetical protein
MIIQVQRESGLQSRTIVLSPRQVRILGFLTSRTGKLLAAGSAVIVAFLMVEAVRVPSLMMRISQMQHTTTQLDTLQHSLGELQRRYDQVRTMMGASPHENDGAVPAGSGPSGLAFPAGSRRASAPGATPEEGVATGATGADGAASGGVGGGGGRLMAMWATQNRAQ